MRLLSRFSYFDIADDPSDVFFRRWKIAKVKLGRLRNVYLHQFFRSDKDMCLHDHPWPFTTVIVWGGYWECTTSGRFWRRPGSILIRPANFLHRIEIEPGSRPWSLVFVGEKERAWGWATAKGWIPWRKGEATPVCETGD